MQWWRLLGGNGNKEKNNDEQLLRVQLNKADTQRTTMASIVWIFFCFSVALAQWSNRLGLECKLHEENTQQCTFFPLNESFSDEIEEWIFHTFGPNYLKFAQTLKSDGSVTLFHIATLTRDDLIDRGIPAKEARVLSNGLEILNDELFFALNTPRLLLPPPETQSNSKSAIKGWLAQLSPHFIQYFRVFRDLRCFSLESIATIDFEKLRRTNIPKSDLAILEIEISKLHFELFGTPSVLLLDSHPSNEPGKLSKISFISRFMTPSVALQHKYLSDLLYAEKYHTAQNIYERSLLLPALVFLLVILGLTAIKAQIDQCSIDINGVYAVAKVLFIPALQYTIVIWLIRRILEVLGWIGIVIFLFIISVVDLYD